METDVTTDLVCFGFRPENTCSISFDFFYRSVWLLENEARPHRIGCEAEGSGEDTQIPRAGPVP